MSHFRGGGGGGGAWQSLKFDKEYLFSFETLVFVTSGILCMHNQLVIPQSEREIEIASHDPFKANFLYWVAFYPHRVKRPLGTK